MNAPDLEFLDDAKERLPIVPAMPEEPVLPLSVEAYHALLKAGIIQDGDPVELLEGFLVPKMGKGLRDELVRRRLVRMLNALIPAGFFVDTQGAATLIDSEPEPDVFVIRGTEEDYADHHAGPADAVIVIEVSDSSIRRDRNWKKRIYARSGVACYWIADLVNNRIEMFTQPTGHTRKPHFEKTAEYRSGDEIPVLIDGKEIGRLTVGEILRSPKPKRKTKR